MVETSCKRCKMWAESGEELHNNVLAYVASLDEELKVSEDQYEERLVSCEACDALINGLCKWCGCFVMARAAKKGLHCPYPKQSKW